MAIYLLSDRGLFSNVSMDPLYELEDILVQTCDAKILAPTARPVTCWASRQPASVAHWLNKVVKRTTGFYNPATAPIDPSDSPNVLLMVALCGSRLELLSSIPNWRQRFDIVAAYVFDSWGPEIYPSYTRQLDHIFVPMPETIDVLKAKFGVPVSLLPFGADALTHGSGDSNRWLDLISYGRIPQPHHRAFIQTFNQPGFDQTYYRSTPRRRESLTIAPYEQRRDVEDTMQLYHLLRKSKLALAYDTVYPGMREFPHSFVTLRWFQCGAAGCAIVGKRPTAPLADELLDWEDSTIELPDDPQASVEFIKALLQDQPRLDAIHQRNYLQNLARHDWRLRIRDWLTTLGVPLPSPLVQELAALNARHQHMSQRYLEKNLPLAR